MKLTDKQRRQMAAEYIEGGTSQRKLAKKYGVSKAYVAKVLKSDPKLAQRLAEKKEENTRSVLQFMDTQKDRACNVIERLLSELDNPDKVKAASLNQIAVSMGILIDKFTQGPKAGIAEVEDLTPLAEMLNDDGHPHD